MADSNGKEVSIPTGSIKITNSWNLLGTAIQFQFQLVRLKSNASGTNLNDVLFQFQLVRLKWIDAIINFSLHNVSIPTGSIKI